MPFCASIDMKELGTLTPETGITADFNSDGENGRPTEVDTQQEPTLQRLVSRLPQASPIGEFQASLLGLTLLGRVV